MKFLKAIKLMGLTKKARREAMKSNLDFESFMMASGIKRTLLEKSSIEDLDALADEIEIMDNTFSEARRYARLAAYRGEDKKDALVDFILDAYTSSTTIKAYMNVYRANLDYMEDLATLVLSGVDIKRFCMKGIENDMEATIADALGLL